MTKKRTLYIFVAIVARILVQVALLIVFSGIGILLPLPLLDNSQKIGVVLFSVATFKLLEQIADVVATQEETANLTKQGLTE